MIKISINEYVKQGIAIREKIALFLGIPIYKYVETTTNADIIASLTKINKPKKVKGFHETKD
jgi:hypothetical protein